MFSSAAARLFFNFQFACLRRREFGIEKFQAFRRVGGTGRIEFLAVLGNGVASLLYRILKFLSCRKESHLLLPTLIVGLRVK